MHSSCPKTGNRLLPRDPHGFNPEPDQLIGACCTCGTVARNEHHWAVAGEPNRVAVQVLGVDSNPLIVPARLLDRYRHQEDELRELLAKMRRNAAADASDQGCE